jgi:AcrR family transcriptional regulator
MAIQKGLKSNIFKPDAQDLFEHVASKSQKQQLRLIEAAIESFAQKGIEGTTYSHLAKVCGISRPLVHHYFPTLEDLFLLTAKYVRITLLNSALDEMRRSKADAFSQINGYVRGCIRWVEEFPDQCSFWLLYFYQASLKGTARGENTKLVQAGHKRIEQLIEQGMSENLWHVQRPLETAKMIQMQITGVLVSCMTEDGYLTSKRAGKLLLETISILLPRSKII